jgi:hypothetical protein
MPYFGIPIRNGLPIGLGSVAGFGVQQFSPADLFSAGEQGAWYDPSDLSTLFTDSAGTTPVTAVEQFVGLMLDKSRGLVLGPELVTNGDFSSGTGWTLTGSAAIIGGELVFVGGAAGTASFSTGSQPAGTYRLKISKTVTGVSGAGNAVIAFRSGSVTVNSYSIGGADGPTTYNNLATNTSAFDNVAVSYNGSGAYEYKFDNVSAQSLFGNHATQTTSAKRPKLAARYNLLQRTEEFNDAAWVKDGGVTVTQNAAVAPDGTTTADLMLGTLNSGMVQNAVGSLAAVNNTTSLYVRADTGSQVRLRLTNASAGADFCQINFNFSTETATFSTGGTATGTTGSATKLLVGSDVWFRLTVSGVASTAAGLARAYVWGVSGSFYIWGADLRPADQATGLIGPTYQRVVDAATYDAVGFLPYLQFDGLSWSMSTGSIDFTATDKMTVWAGVRKLSDGAQQALTELSAAYNSNNGAFVITAAEAGQTVYGVGLNQSVSGFYLPSPFAAPITNVVNASFNFAGAALSDKIIPRINGVQNQNNPGGSAPSVGNFGNYPLFIGARNNASQFFSGWLTSLIVRGAQSTQGQIEATEAWVNQRTGAF